MRPGTDWVLRLSRSGRGECENRWMDAHIKVSGPTAALRGALIDDNRNSLIGWTDKCNRDASRSTVDLLNLQMPYDSVAHLRGGFRAELKRWLKERVRAPLPGRFRALVYFLYRDVQCGWASWTAAPGSRSTSCRAFGTAPGQYQGRRSAAVHAGGGRARGDRAGVRV